VRTRPPGPISTQALTRTVPRAPVRGAQATRSVRTISPAAHQRSAEQLRSWVRQQNARPAVSPGVRPTHDVLGYSIPARARFFGPPTLTQVNVNYMRVVNVFGEPRHHYLFLPRERFYPGFFDVDDGFFAYNRFEHPTVVVINFFYPYYFSQPYWYAFSYPGYYPSVYSLWGWCPGWVYPNRVYYYPYEYVYSGGPYSPERYPLDYTGAEAAIYDLRVGWLKGDVGRFSSHLSNQVDVRIYFNGKYDYSTSADDFYAMTADTLATVETVDISFERPIWLSGREVFYTGRQVFRDPDGSEHALYISYRLRKLGAGWYIVAFGSSPNPIQHNYHDYRYR
jgi:hypothetical protein